ncbi:putative multiple sugar transport system permease protein [Actinoplanes lutulentus]|uniref:Xylose transport system permease protein XylH n=1 Tax=Actinoplanes lutulentus TaxID=1287878 RepID=A0A327Z1F8_9ACTN|nr:multiple monosaccharide ABC transporter permease [Actinoplanes lutulentus]MBB2943629.1 putative multiple sugar transport system permease protein [Actinoplanes lutulentus]RAK27494.1 putative multiple sugar transport system permease protein [Actinoplanes lutulentus]
MSASTTLAQPSAAPDPSKKNDGGSLKSYLGQNLRQYSMIGALVVIVVLFQIFTDGKLLLPNNVASLIQQNAYVFILTIGMVMIIVAGHIDLSVGSVVAFVGGVTALMITDHDIPWLLAVVLAVVLGGVVGAWQGFWVAYVGIPAFIVTLGGMLIFRGLAIVLVGTTVAGLPSGFNDISNGSLPAALGYLGNLDGLTVLIGVLAAAGIVISQIRTRRELVKNDLRAEPFAAFIGKLVVSIIVVGYITYLLASSAGGTPIVLIIVGALVLIYTFVMNNTVFGRHVYAMGGNLPAAMLSGVKTKRVNFMLFVNMGMLAGVAAVITTSRAGSAVAAAGTNFELDAIAAAFIGGTAVNGGVGKVTGAIIGALIMGVLNIGLSIMAVDAAWQQAFKGLVLIAAVAFDIMNKRRSK